MSDVKSLVQSYIKDNTIMVFSKSYCPYCRRVKDLFTKLGLTYKVIELDQVDQGSDIQNYLAELTKQRTVPNVFVKGKHIGGCTETMEANKSGYLTTLLNN
ncbi:putative glutaredoxin Grx1 [Piptocephalis cylindrospora]|uniref:Putative glutaredoxin Grx1 n=1 Tax=Piptocephalis cylindrospora TaxID=1907219 RepID=A0A4P9Y1U4_9FUNG|nr:putative glutaredoxin Grx1 [Piptocephalis cylindrospora]|eukprot:RKP12808.1 putative glutaredoxin Grx1 [Piptocephalis cylindrospora]